MSRYFMEGVFSPAGMRRTREEVAAMEAETELHLLDRELDLLLKDDFLIMEAVGGDLMDIPEVESAESADDVLNWFRRVKAGQETEAYDGRDHCRDGGQRRLPPE